MVSNSDSFLSDEDISTIVKNAGVNVKEILDYNVINLNEKMLGYMADYYKLKIDIKTDLGKETLNYFIKAIPRTNEAKAEMALSMNLFDQELNFYRIIKGEIENPEIPPWSAKLIASLEEATIYEDLDAQNYRVRNKFQPFDEPHTFQALQTLARFHASSLIYEEKKRIEIKDWRIEDAFDKYYDIGGYKMTHPWYIQCMDGTLGAILSHSKFKSDILKMVESRWTEVWSKNLDLGEPSNVFRNVVTHNDLWNNNLMFHYNENVPDDCKLVDFQGVRIQPPAADVMLLLHCNLDLEYREKHMNMFLNYYYNTLKDIFDKQGMSLTKIMTLETFLESAEKYRQWGLFLAVCLYPTIWIKDEVIAEIFGDTQQYKDILTKNKRAFINNMIENNEGFKNKLLPIYEELVERYFL
ncbi:uncharacterized kinase-like protein D1044.1 [Aricia agestis]|uniref:uncharacterized kinase-like protein D1044.1 n=1 Tax=Aricia agestis TaxID=91739 RepID=UPI001C208BCC|nr:uncharacterized kinase-like protein D1044.1 [Aricia agestis]